MTPEYKIFDEDFLDEELDDLDEDELMEDIPEVEWGPEEKPIEDFLKNLEAEHDDWVEEKISQCDTPVYVTNAPAATVLDSLPLDYMGLKENISILIDIDDPDEEEDAEVVVFFDDRPSDSVVDDDVYEATMQRKVRKMKKQLGKGYKTVIKIINEKHGKGKVTRIAYLGGD